MLFTDKYHPDDKIAGKVRNLTDYGVFVGIEEGVDGMVHKSDLSWSVRVNNPSDLYHKGDDVDDHPLDQPRREEGLSASSSSGTIRGRACSRSSRWAECSTALKVLSVVDYGVCS
ncbi:MAG: S1 RNA-binding domain-containing protein [Polyangiaceae bacterium]